MLQDAYLALRAWAWKALDQRRRDPELREWGDILRAAASLMARHGQPALAERLAALHELVGESIAAGEALAAHDVTRRRHVSGVLDFLAGNGGQAGRGAIGAHTSLSQANLTRVLNLMAAAGLVKRSMLGGEAVFRLARTGLEVPCARLQGPPRTGSPPSIATDLVAWIIPFSGNDLRYASGRSFARIRPIPANSLQLQPNHIPAGPVGL